MDCRDARSEISARLDGEADPALLAPLDEHLGGCAACRTHAAAISAAHRTVRLRAAEPVPPDLTAGVLAAIGAVDRAPRVGGLRIGLVIVGAVQVLLAVPALVFGDDAGLPTHTARHLGSFAAALGIGFLVAAWQPRRVGGIFPVVAVLSACLLASAAVDIATGVTALGAELGAHALEVVGLGLVWMLGRETGQLASVSAWIGGRLADRRAAHS